MTLEVVVLAGGFGTRLRRIVADVPKPMAPVGGRPFLEIILGALVRKGVRRAVLSVGYLAETIVSYFGDHFESMELVYEVEQRPRGTGGAVAAALRRCHGDRALVLNGDTYLDLEIPALESAWDGAPVIVARHVPDTSRYGCLRVSGKRVVGFLEKSTGGPGYINAGAYLLPVAFFSASMPSEPFSLETDVLSHKVASHRFDVFVTRGTFIDIGIPEDYERAQTMVFGGEA